MYEEDFEQAFLKATEDFFVVASVDKLSKSTTPQYLLWAETQFIEESDRCKKFLDPTAEQKVMLVLDRELIQKHSSTLLTMPNSDLASMMREDKVFAKHWFDLCGS